MSAQLALALGHAAAEQAADHAGPSWQEQAFAAFVAYAQSNAILTTEEVRLWASDIPAPPDKRAWGQIALLAKRQGVVRSAGWTRANSLTVHGMVVTRWQSMICREPRP